MADIDTDLAQARDRGRREGLALAALALSLVAFINLLGAEKSLLAVVLAVIAMRGARVPLVLRRSRLAIGFAMLHLLTFVVVIVLFHDKLAELLRLMHSLA
jgi:hypothetical protein